MPFKRMIKSGNICILSGIVSFILYFSSHIRHTISLCKYVKCHVFISGCWWTGGLPSSCSGLWFPSAPWIPDPASPPQTIPSVWISARQWKVQNMHMNRQYIVAASAALHWDLVYSILSIYVLQASCPFCPQSIVEPFKIVAEGCDSNGQHWRKTITLIQNAALGKHLLGLDIKSCFVTALVSFTLLTWL